MKIYSIVVGFENKYGKVEFEETEELVYEKLHDAVDRILNKLKMDNVHSYSSGTVVAEYENKNDGCRNYAYIMQHRLKKVNRYN